MTREATCPNCSSEGWPSQIRMGEEAFICGSRSFDFEVIGTPSAACRVIADLRRRLALRLVA